MKPRGRQRCMEGLEIEDLAKRCREGSQQRSGSSGDAWKGDQEGALLSASRSSLRRGCRWIKTYSRETGWGFIVCKEALLRHLKRQVASVQVERDIFVHWKRGAPGPVVGSLAAELMAMGSLAQRVRVASGGLLELRQVPGHGRCLRAVQAVAAKGLLARERPLALGSTDGQALAQVCGEADVEASEDLCAALVLLELEGAMEATVAMELQGSKAEVPGLLWSLADSVVADLEAKGGAAEVLRKWQGICDVNAETWVEIRPEESGRVRFLFGLFGALAMAEHSCQPNARAEWDEQEQSMNLVAVRAIKAGDRVSRSYLDIGALLSEVSRRQESLMRDWNFKCECERCLRELLEPLPQPPLSCLQLDLQGCVEPEGLLLDEALKCMVRQAAEACEALNLPHVGSLHVLEAALARDLRCLSLSGPAKRPRLASDAPKSERRSGSRVRPVRGAFRLVDSSVFARGSGQDEDTNRQCPGADDQR